ncbi:MarR family winged helix-turn-helix transcriptional regulator [Thalassobacillus pellis]|uniref:MarR family winged helix-turn-helix transcriptional regulator n=1 Tax=Thalassobacillus pellis TaxID=748008 RepID=UPI0019612D9F|nr:MarR family transcriptional regulator [Thalassobacillus pellis]
MQLQQLERHPRTFGEAGALTPSEIHTIDAIGLEHGILMSELADRLGVTKGAITQIVTRKKMKELVKRTPHPTDSRAVLVSLTEKGKDAYRAHETLHQHFYQQLRSQLDPKEIEIFERCIEKLNTFLEK